MRIRNTRRDALRASRFIQQRQEVGAGPVLAQGFILSQTFPPILQNVETQGKVEAVL